jgi:hypothetical protein
MRDHGRKSRRLGGARPEACRFISARRSDRCRRSIPAQTRDSLDPVEIARCGAACVGLWRATAAASSASTPRSIGWHGVPQLVRLGDRAIYHRSGHRGEAHILPERQSAKTLHYGIAHRQPMHMSCRKRHVPDARARQRASGVAPARAWRRVTASAESPGPETSIPWGPG